VGLLDEPRGWRQLHAIAQQERDPQRLASFIDQMNSLLDRHEKMEENENLSTSATIDPDNLIKLEVRTWQFDA
jgi:hypothetical protein